MPKETKAAKPAAKSAVRYVEGVGRRKTAVARVRVISGKGIVTVNKKPIEHYFPPAHLQKIVRAPLEAVRLGNTHDVQASVRGGGIHAQAEAVRHGLARALVGVGEEFKKPLRTLGYLTRDPRMVERKKYGLRKARRAPQWQKR